MDDALSAIHYHEERTKYRCCLDSVSVGVSVSKKEITASSSSSPLPYVVSFTTTQSEMGRIAYRSGPAC